MPLHKLLWSCCFHAGALCCSPLAFFTLSQKMIIMTSDYTARTQSFSLSLQKIYISEVTKREKYGKLKIAAFVERDHRAEYSCALASSPFSLRACFRLLQDFILVSTFSIIQFNITWLKTRVVWRPYHEQKIIYIFLSSKKKSYFVLIWWRRWRSSRWWIQWAYMYNVIMCPHNVSSCCVERQQSSQSQ